MGCLVRAAPHVVNRSGGGAGCLRRPFAGVGPPSALSVLAPCAPPAWGVPPMAAGARKGLRIRSDGGPTPAPHVASTRILRDELPLGAGRTLWRASRGGAGGGVTSHMMGGARGGELAAMRA